MIMTLCKHRLTQTEKSTTNVIFFWFWGITCSKLFVNSDTGISFHRCLCTRPNRFLEESQHRLKCAISGNILLPDEIWVYWQDCQKTGMFRCLEKARLYILLVLSKLEFFYPAEALCLELQSPVDMTNVCWLVMYNGIK